MDKILIIAWNMIRRSIGTFRGLMVFILLPGVVVAAIISLPEGWRRSRQLCYMPTRIRGQPADI